MKPFATAALSALLFTFNSPAVVTYWDPTGTTATPTPNGNWEDLAWTTTSALTPTPVSWVDSSAACFSAGTAATGSFTVGLNSTQNIAGIFNGGLSGTAPGIVTINGTGTINVPAGQQGFSTSSPGTTTINVPITGTCQMVLERTGQIYLYGTNTYTGGTQLGFSSSPFSGTVNINNASSLGTGPISMVAYTSGANLTLQGGLAVTLPNSFVTYPTNLNINGNSAGLTFAGPWTMTGIAGIGSGGTVLNLVTISGVMSGSGGLVKYNPGILKLTAANIYTGSTTISNGTLALGPSGSINNTASLRIVPGANGSVFDVSAIGSYLLGGATTLIAQGLGTLTSTSANIKGAAGGTVSLGSRPVSLIFTPTSFAGDNAHPALYVSQGALTLNNNTITVTNAGASPLGAGTYRLVQVGSGAGVINGAPNSTVSIFGSGVATNTFPYLAVSNGVGVVLVVRPAATISAISLTQSNVPGIGVTSVRFGGKVASGSVYPANGEAVNLRLNNSLRTPSISDTVGDFFLATTPSSIPYSATNNFTFSYAGNSALGPATNVMLLPGHGFFSGDAAPGFFGGLNLFFTNSSGIAMSIWSSTNPALPVTDWNLEGQMTETTLSDSPGKSRYSFTVAPDLRLVYYLSGPSVTWPFLSPTSVQSVTSNDDSSLVFSATNTTITSAGVLTMPAAPVLITSPASQTILAGKSATFTAVVTGSQPMSYQWYFNGTTPIAGQPGNVLTITNPGPADLGSYFVIATNSLGSVTSAPASLNIVSPPQIAPSVVSNAVELDAASIPNLNYSIQSSTNLSVWNTIANRTSDTNGLIQFTDPAGLSSPTRFYRILFP